MSLLCSPEGGSELAEVYREYAAVAKGWNLPIVLFAPTWRANREQAASGANRQALDFVRPFSQSAGALMGPRGDCYSPSAALSREEARRFHAWQANELADADFILIATMPSVSEALGIADVVSVPCLVSFVITARGALLDGTPLEDAIAQIDDKANARPLGYWINCVHPLTAFEGLHQIEARGGDSVIHRIVGCQGNTSPLDPRSFSIATDFQSDPEAAFANGMLEVHRRFSIPILGGCCGTREAHLDAIARLLAAETPIVAESTLLRKES